MKDLKEGLPRKIPRTSKDYKEPRGRAVALFPTQNKGLRSGEPYLVWRGGETISPSMLMAKRHG